MVPSTDWRELFDFGVSVSFVSSRTSAWKCVV